MEETQAPQIFELNQLNITGIISSDIERKINKKGNIVYKAKLTQTNRNDKSMTFAVFCFENEESKMKNIKPGDRVSINGSLECREYTKKDGKTGFATEIKISHIDKISNL